MSTLTPRANGQVPRATQRALEAVSDDSPRTSPLLILRTLNPVSPGRSTHTNGKKPKLAKLIPGKVIVQLSVVPPITAPANPTESVSGPPPTIVSVIGTGISAAAAGVDRTAAAAANADISAHSFFILPSSDLGQVERGGGQCTHNKLDFDFTIVTPPLSSH